MTPLLRVKPCSCWFSAQRPARRDDSHGATETRRLIHRTVQNPSSVPPCETLLLLVQCSKTTTTQLQNPSSVSPCLRVKPAPVSSVLKDQHDVMTHTEPRSHGGSSTAQNPTSVPPCETQPLMAHDVERYASNLPLIIRRIPSFIKASPKLSKYPTFKSVRRK